MFIIIAFVAGIAFGLLTKVGGFFIYQIYQYIFICKIVFYFTIVNCISI
jgi:hypothetical protein